MTTPIIYFDNAATTPLDESAAVAMNLFFRTGYGNPNSPHALGKEARRAVETAKEETAALIGADPGKIRFAPSGTIANRMVLNAFPIRHIAVSPIEHKSVLSEIPPSGVMKILGAKRYLDGSDLEARILVRGKPELVSVMTVNNETGIINDVKSIAAAARSSGAMFHTDATAAAGAIPIDVNEIGCDFLTFSAHKLYGPKGIAAVYDRNGLLSDLPYMGTENVPAIVGFGEACRTARETLAAKRSEYSFDADNDYDEIASAFLSGVSSEYCDGVSYLRLDESMHLKKIINVVCEDVDAETLVLLCSERGLMVSAGAACESNEKKPSHVLTAVGLDENLARSAIRISFSRFTAEDEAYRGGAILGSCARLLRETPDFA